jgi:hypothetical protein
VNENQWTPRESNPPGPGANRARRLGTWTPNEG